MENMSQVSSLFKIKLWLQSHRFLYNHESFKNDYECTLLWGAVLRDHELDNLLTT